MQRLAKGSQKPFGICPRQSPDGHKNYSIALWLGYCIFSAGMLYFAR